MHFSPCMYLLALILLWIASASSAQCTYTSNGFIFLHPFFNQTNWVATLYTADVDAPEMCEMDITSLSIDKRAARGTVIFSTSDNKWHLSKAPLVNDECLCCRPAVFFEPPSVLSLPAALQLQTAAPFSLINTQGMPSDSLYMVVPAADKVFMLHLHASSGALGSVDTIAVTLPSGGSITGIHTEHTSSGIDTAYWITGSKGLLAAVSLNAATRGNVTHYVVPDAPTLLCAGNGYAGSSDGRIFTRSGTSFTLDTTLGTAPIRNINSRFALGDAGTVMVRRNGNWQLFVNGTASYRYGNLTSSRQGTTIELIDEKWQYTSHVLFDTPSSMRIGALGAISSDTLPNGTYVFRNGNISPSVPITITDQDNNRVTASFRIHHPGVSRETIVDSTIVPRQNTAAICTTQITQLADSTLSLGVGNTITVSVPVVKSLKTGCEFWRWQQSNALYSYNWTLYDTLVVTLGAKTVRILNLSIATFTTASQKASAPNRFGLQFGRQHIALPVLAAPIKMIMLIDAQGRTIWKSTTDIHQSASYTLPQSAFGMHIVVVQYANGTKSTHRILLSGK